MNRSAITLAGVSAAALSLAACYPPHPHHRRDEPLKAIASLNCPNSQGDLTRTSAAADGKSCTYTDDAGAQITLQLVAVTAGDAKTSLAPIEAQLRSEMPAAPTTPTPPAPPGTPAPPGSDKDRVDIDLPGIHIHANGHDNGASGGVNINAGDHGAQVRIDKDVNIGGGSAGMSGHGGVTINAGDNGAEIRVSEPGSGMRFSFILASDNPGPHGYKLAGYEARGPASGPLVVASILAKSEEHDDLYHDVHKLLSLNVGG